MAKRKSGIYPAPVYEAHLSDGNVYRLSFHSPQGRPVDFEAGRRAAEEILLTDWDREKVRWERAPDGAWRGRWARVPLQITRGFVEHPETLGTRLRTTGELFADLQAGKRPALRAPLKIEHKPGSGNVVELPKRRRKAAAAPAAGNAALLDALRYVRGLAEDIASTKPGPNGRTRASWIVKACNDALAKAGENREAA